MVKKTLDIDGKKREPRFDVVDRYMRNNKKASFLPDQRYGSELSNFALQYKAIQENADFGIVLSRTD